MDFPNTTKISIDFSNHLEKKKKKNPTTIIYLFIENNKPIVLGFLQIIQTNNKIYGFSRSKRAC
jgi:hypothetical protein